MIGIDTNVLARLFVDDTPSQAAAARRFVTKRCTKADPGFVNRVTLCETVWVLASVFGYDRSRIVSVVEELLASTDIVLEDHDAVGAALNVFAKRGIDFADILVAEINRLRGCGATATFDRRAAKLDGFVQVA